MTYDLVRLQRVADTTRQYSVAYVFWQLQAGFPAAWIHDRKIRPRWSRYFWWIPRKPIEDRTYTIDPASMPPRTVVAYTPPKQAPRLWDEIFHRLLSRKALLSRRLSDCSGSS